MVEEVNELKNQLIDLSDKFRRHNHDGIETDRLPATIGWEIVAQLQLTTADGILIDTGTIPSYDLYRITVHAIAPSGSNIAPFIQFNGDTSTNYDFTRTRIAGTQVINLDTATSNILLGYGTIAAGETGTYSIILGKSASDKHAKLIVDAAYYDVDLSSIVRSNIAGTWRNTSSKITRILIATTANQFDTGSVAVIEGFNF